MRILIKTIFFFLSTALCLHAQESSLLKHLNYFSSLPDRISGTDSCNKAAEYIKETFRSIGIKNIQTETFKVVVPIQEYAHISIGNKKIPLESLWPNSVRTCTTPPE
ncbi:MAG: hypothetical protein NC902_08720, partial [Candidatus Omnitrophica bacterium]|nr:hypothetical protein [Candidatus Omnitrophota bacterium]